MGVGDLPGAWFSAYTRPRLCRVGLVSGEGGAGPAGGLVLGGGPGQLRARGGSDGGPSRGLSAAYFLWISEMLTCTWPRWSGRRRSSRSARPSPGSSSPTSRWDSPARGAARAQGDARREGRRGRYREALVRVGAVATGALGVAVAARTEEPARGELPVGGKCSRSWQPKKGPAPLK